MNFAPFLSHSFAVLIHIVTAVLALALGIVLLARRKGTRGHKALGRIWAALMLVVAASSFWITGIAGPGRFSVIHLLSVFTIAMLALAVWAIRSGRVRTHRFTMIGIFAGGLIGAGAGALAPGRLISQMLGYG
jgi:uncharacterized membrane protein